MLQFEFHTTGTRMTGVHRTTIVELLVNLGAAFSEYQDKAFFWSFIGAKEKNCPVKMKAKGAGDVWTWVALDARTKLVPCWFIGERHAGCAFRFLSDVNDRLPNGIQLTTDGHKAYLHAVDPVFGTEIDYAMLQKSPAQRQRAHKGATAPLFAWERARRSSTAIPITSTFPRATWNGRTSRCACPCGGSPPDKRLLEKG
jgi:IS1 family transposase